MTFIEIKGRVGKVGWDPSQYTIHYLLRTIFLIYFYCHLLKIRESFEIELKKRGLKILKILKQYNYIAAFLRIKGQCRRHFISSHLQGVSGESRWCVPLVSHNIRPSMGINQVRILGGGQGAVPPQNSELSNFSNLKLQSEN